uniref:ATP synthase F0 subunit 8 n=1 Tax=Nanatka castenea TaxID=3004264 RepID=A0A9E9FWF2_9HEMI|nr:ATP synthase F0 subunit 8 [Nanatka castenea]WAP91648.1 ATP synthase F0 subunit 8 [Nanatka castenea]
MPQMAPMWWTLLMILFIFSMILTNSMMYFNMLNKIITINKMKTLQMNWKW